MQKLLLVVCAAALACSAAPPSPSPALHAAPSTEHGQVEVTTSPDNHGINSKPETIDKLSPPTSSSITASSSANTTYNDAAPSTTGTKTPKKIEPEVKKPTNKTASNTVPGATNIATTKPTDANPEPTQPSIAEPTTKTTSNDTTPASNNGTAPTPASNNGTSPSTTPNATKPPATTTEQAKVVPTPVPVTAARGFDGASFIGGIVLAMGLLAVGFMGFKYYKTQTERNYHTL